MITTPFGFAPSAGGFPIGGSPVWGSSFPSPFVSPIQSWNKPLGFSPWSSFAGGPTSTIPAPWNTFSPISPIGATPWSTATPWTPFAGPWSWQSQFTQTPWTTGSFGQIPVGQFPFSQVPFGQFLQIPFSPFGQVPFSQVPFGQIPFGQIPFGQIPFAQGWSAPMSQYAPFVGGFNGQYSPARNGYTPNGHFPSNGVTSTVGQTTGHIPVGQFPTPSFPFGQFGFGSTPFSGFQHTTPAPYTPYGSMSPFSAAGFTSPFGYTPATYGGMWPASPYTPHTTGFNGSFNGQGFATPANYPYPHTENETPVGAGQRDAA